MKTRQFITSMTIMMVLGTTTMFGQGRRHHNEGSMGYGRQGGRQEMVMHDNGRMEMRGGNHQMTMDNRQHRGGHVAMYNEGRVRHHDIRGYEDRVRFCDGHWSYLRDDRWYHYDHFIDPYDYYNRPLSHWGRGIIIGTVVGAIISSLIR